MLSDIQIKALERGIWVLEGDDTYHVDVFAVNSDGIIVDTSSLGDWDCEEYNYYRCYDMDDYGRKWALTKKELHPEISRYVLIKQIFFNSRQIVVTQKYEYEIKENFKIGDLVYVPGNLRTMDGDHMALKTIGKIVGERPKREHCNYTTIKHMTKALKQTYSEYLPLLDMTLPD